MQRIAHNLSRYLEDCAAFVAAAPPYSVSGRLTRATGLVMEATGLRLPVGSSCVIEQDNLRIEAEVVGFAKERLYLMPAGDVYGFAPGATVRPLVQRPQAPAVGRKNHPWRRREDRTKHLPVGDALLGRVLDANGAPLDAQGALSSTSLAPLASRPINPIDREPIRDVLDVGVRAINALLTVGRGQRIGLFAGSGVGKSVLIGMMARYTQADVIVVGLIGERGREVKEFLDHNLTAGARERSVVVAAPADTPPLMRIQAANYATAVAEHFRDRGKHVLLIMDSLTRYAMAQREIALAIGEPPATKGYPPSVFARLPQLVERAGNGKPGKGSITAFYTVLAEGDDQQDPIADNARAILDGHIVLSRTLADAGHYPAIDIEQSVSRVMSSVVPPQHLELARRFKALYSRYQRGRDLLAVGAYVQGSDPLLDEAIAKHADMTALLTQKAAESARFSDASQALAALF